MSSESFRLFVSRFLSGAFVVMVAFPCLITKSASDPLQAANSFDEIWKKSQSFRPEPSTDTKPLLVKVGDVSYRIPRNYISNLHFDFPVLKVTYPGFEPLTEETRGCFDPKIREELGCTTLELNLAVLSLSNKARFENGIKAAPPYHGRLTPRPGPEGYEVYNLGPENARLEKYRSESEDIFFECRISNYNGGREAVCDDYVSLADGNAVWFFFHLNQIPDVRKIESGIRQLMSSFQTGGDNK